MTTFHPLTPFHKAWVQARTRHPWVEDSQGVVACQGARVVGAAVLDSFTATTANVHFCVDNRAATLHLIYEAATLAFLKLDLKAVYAGIPSTNTPAVRLALKLGFEMTAVLRDAVEPDIDRFILILRADDFMQSIKRAA